jgi:hypothetical protein
MVDLPSPQERARILSAFLLAIVALAVFAGCDSTTTRGRGAAAEPTSTWEATATPWPTSTPIPVPTSTPAPAWVTYSVEVADTATRVYRIDVPGALTCGKSSAPPNHTILPCEYTGSPLPPQHPVGAEVSVELDAAWITDANFPCRTGVRVVVGPGIAGFQSDNVALSAPGNCFDPAPPTEVRAFWIAGGVCYQLRMYAGASPQTFHARYDAIWRHMLASFAPAPAASSGDVCR